MMVLGHNARRAVRTKAINLLKKLAYRFGSFLSNKIKKLMAHQSVVELEMVISAIVELPQALINDQNTPKLGNWVEKILLKFDVLLRNETQRLIIYLCVIIHT